MNTAIRAAVRSLAALDLASSRALAAGNEALGCELAQARSFASFAARSLGFTPNEIDYLTGRAVRVAQALERQRIARATTAANDATAVAA